jgi:hypothetical protein
MSEDSSTKLIAFRVTQKEFEFLEEIAGFLASKGKIKNDSVNTLCKAFMYVKANEFKQIQLMQEEIESRERAALEANKTV